MVSMQAAKMMRNPMMMLMIFIGVCGSEYDTAKTTGKRKGGGVLILVVEAANRNQSHTQSVQPIAHSHSLMP
jgi:hypothetical protein